MKILQLHNYYQISGGEDAVVHAERKLLQDSGHDVLLFSVDNNEIRGITNKIKTGLSSFYSHKSRTSVGALLKTFAPDVVHCHNFFPLLTPSVYDACNEHKTPIVQTLHNYRIICPNALLFREGAVCEACVGKSFPWPAVSNSCYRGSRFDSLAASSIMAFHNIRKSWNNVDMFIALTEFQKTKLVEAGFSKNNIAVKPNFVHSFPLPAQIVRQNFALFVGRLSPEKGIVPLLRSYRDQQRNFPWKIVGDGPDLVEVKELAATLPNVEVLGRLQEEDVKSLMLKAKLLIFPSRWYEGFPMTILEAYSNALPVIAYDIGGLAEIIKNGETGRLVPLNDDNQMLEIVQSILSCDSSTSWGKAARIEYESRYSPNQNLEQLNRIYHDAVNEYR